MADFFWGTSNQGGRFSIPHYYGDSVRQLLVGASTLMIVASPFYSDALGLQFPFIIVGALLSASLAALMNPRDQRVSLGSAVLSGSGLAIYTMWGMAGYDTINPIAFVLRLAIGVVFLFAFYFSMKTLRAFSLGQIGKRETVDEFEDPDERMKQEILERESMREKRDTA